MNKHPSEIHKDLTSDRINEIGLILAKARYENLEAVDERDDSWSIGCRAYSWCRSELINQQKHISYLSIKDPGLKFVFRIGQAEISIYRGESTKPKKNIYSRAQCYPELKQLGLISNFEIPEKIVWAYAVETDLDGNTTNIEFFGMDESGDIIASHIVPIHQVANSVVIPVSTSEASPVDLPAAAVSLSTCTDQKVKERNEKQTNISGR